MLAQPVKLALSAFCALTAAAPATGVDLGERAVLVDPYAPVQTTCPSASLVRPATSINSNEASYVAARKTNADASLTAWLKKQGSFGTSSVNLGFTSSGGGYRSLLTTAGVVQAFDSRDTKLSTGGVYQGLTYQAGLSGGAWFLSSLAGNNWPTISYLQTNLWDSAFQNSALVPANLLSVSDDTEYAAIVVDIDSKAAAGYAPTIVDPYGRLLSYQLLEGTDGGVSIYLSSLTTFSNFTSHNVPFPIITATVVNGSEGQCYPTLNATIFEFSPYEYGAWDGGIDAFALTQYMGSNLTDGRPTKVTCTVHYDNLGYIFGTSSDVFNAACEAISASNSSSSSIENVLEGIISTTHTPEFEDLFGIYPNPFYKYPQSPAVENNTLLTLVDGGESDQNNPIWPFIQPERSVDVLIVNDNSADTDTNFPNGTEPRQTYLNAQAAGLTKMPYIPPVSTFVSEGLNERATFFGCNETGTVFIVFLPNVAYTYPSGQSTEKVEYTIPETDGMIANGNAVATQNGTADWPFCLACAIENKSSSLPKNCTVCFEKYCYYQSGTTG